MKWDITKNTHRRIEKPRLQIALYQPEIPANTGNIARLCGAAELKLHLIHPLGFRVDDRSLKRAGLDYWHEVDVAHHVDFHAFLDAVDRGAGLIAFSRHAERPYTEASISPGGVLLFGSETRGLPDEIHRGWPCYRIPIWGKVRSLNLSTSVGIVSYHFLHGLGFF
ncbi:MAG TPA: tRNA (cytidine(34)-2'-O)-methyltransferase [Desulfobacteraceae bacterium]|nr:tRNA (cytidine(34)-2'-O)-methyltransferase [Desulfobacteraceae bacterium]